MGMCLDCLKALQASIAVALQDFEEFERQKNNDIMLPMLEKTLEKVKKMTSEEYLEFIAQIPPMDEECRQGWDNND